MHGLIGTPPRPAKTRRARVVFHNVMGGELGHVALSRKRRTLARALRHAKQSRPFIVSLHQPGETLRPQDDTVVLRAAWATTIVQPGATVLVTYLPAGGGATGGQSTGKQIGMAVAVLALAVVAPYAVAAGGAAIGLGGLAVGTLANAAVSAGIVVGASYLYSVATKAKANETNDSDRPVYGVSGGGNLGRAGDRIPLLYGRCWTQPDLSQPDYTVYDGEDQILYARYTLGLGKYQIHTLMLGTATLWTNASGIQPPFSQAPGGGGAGEIGSGIAFSGTGTDIEFIAPGGVSALVPGSVYSAPEIGAIELPRPSDVPAVAGPFPVTPLGQSTARIQLDYSLPQGAYGTIKSSGVDVGTNWNVLFEYAPCDDDNLPTGAFTPLHANSGFLLVKRAQRFTRYIDVPLGRYVVRGRNQIDWVNPATDSNENAFGIIVNSLMWDGLRAHFTETITRPHVTEIAMRVRSGKGLGVTAFADLWVEATRILPTWGGVSWVEAPTRKAVYAFKDILQSSYGAGLTDAEVDLERIKFYAASLSTHDTFDGVIRGPVSVWEAGATVLGTMRAEPARIGNTWSLTRDEQRTARKHVFSRRQVLRGSSGADFKISRNDGAADIIVEYAPGGDPRRRRNARVTFGAESLTPRRVNLMGVTSHEHAHHLATWMAASAYFRRERRKISVNRQGRIVNRGDPVRIDNWFMADAKAAGVMSRAGNTLTLDTALVVTVSPVTHAMLRNRRAQEFGPIKVTQGASPNIIILDAADLAAVETFFGQTLSDVLALDDEHPTTVLVGPLLELNDGYLIDAVTPQGREVVAIEAVYDAQGVWDALLEPAPPAPLIPSGGDIFLPPYPVVPWIRARATQKATSLEMEWAVGRARGAARYVVQASYDSGATWETVSEDESTSGTWVLRHVEGVTVKVGAFAISATGSAGPSVYTEFTTFAPIIPFESIIIQIEMFNDALAKLVTTDIKEITDRIQEITQAIARHAVEQDISQVVDRMRQNGNLKETRNILEAQVGDALASVEEVARAGTDLEGAFAEYQISVDAKIGAPGSEAGTIQASVDTVADAVVDTNTAVGTLTTNVNAKIGAPGSTGTIQSSVVTVSNAVADLEDGLSAQWGVTLNVNGYISGLKLLSDETFSAFTVQSDLFRVVLPGGAGGGAQTIFQVGAVNGGNRLVLKGDMLADGTITAREISAGSISTVKLGAQVVTSEKIALGGVDIQHLIDGAATAIAIAQGGGFTGTCSQGNPAWDLVALGFTTKTGRLAIDFNCDFSSVGTFALSAFSYQVRMDILINGGLYRSATERSHRYYNGPTNSYIHYHSACNNVMTYVNVGVGTHTIVGRIQIVYEGWGGGSAFGEGQQIQFLAPTLRVTELRR